MGRPISNSPCHDGPSVDVTADDVSAAIQLLTDESKHARHTFARNADGSEISPEAREDGLAAADSWCALGAIVACAARRHPGANINFGPVLKVRPFLEITSVNDHGSFEDVHSLLSDIERKMRVSR